jgi:uncharacterized protein
MLSSRHVRAFVLVSVVSLIIGSPVRARAPVRSLLEIREAGVVIQKWDLSCGAAALATILTYYFDDAVPERIIAEAMLARADPKRVQRAGGFSLLDLQEFAEARGYAADGYGEVTLQDLAALVPAIVPIKLNGYDHFVVVRAVNGAFVQIADPGFGNRNIKTTVFERSWIDNIAFVVTRPAP